MAHAEEASGRDVATADGERGTGSRSPLQDWTRRTEGVVASRRARQPFQLQPGVVPEVLRDVQQDLVRHQTTLLAAGIAFRAFIALFPVVIVAVTTTALLQPGEEIAFQARRLMAGLPAQGRLLIMEQIEAVVDPGQQSGLRVVLVVASIAAVWTASSALQGTLTALTATQGEDDGRSWVRQRVLALKLTAGAIPFVIVSVGMITGVPLVLRGAGLGSFVRVLGVLGTLILLALMMVSALAILYRYGPSRRAPRLPWASPGAVAATVLWIIGSEALKLVTDEVGGYDARYGVATGVVMILLWLWLTAWCVLFGSTLNARLEHQTAVDSTVGPARPVGERGAVPADRHPDRPRDPPEHGDANGAGVDTDGHADGDTADVGPDGSNRTA